MDNKKKMPLLILKGLTILPKALLHIDIKHEFSVTAVEQAMEEDQLIFLVTQKNQFNDEPDISEDIYAVGTIARIKQIVKMPKNNISVVVEGMARGKLVDFTRQENFYQVAVEYLPEILADITAEEKEAYFRNIREEVAEFVHLAAKIDKQLVERVMAAESLSELADGIATYLLRSIEQKQEILEELDEEERIKKVSQMLLSEIEIIKVQRKLHEEVRRSLEKNQRDYVLKEQLKAIQDELGDDEDNEIEEYKQKIKKLKAPTEVKQKLEKERNRLSRMPMASPDASTIRNYLDAVLEYPWGKASKESIDLKKAEAVLDEDHYGLEKVKERVLEHLAVRRLSKDANSPIICLVGPPGTGKTSVVRSIARAVNREYVRISLGGVRDEAEIRGHRKTYVGAMPGRIVAAMKQAGTTNPLILLDELDKTSSDFRGNPAAALLEVLDGEQNKSFRDHYFEIPIDLSNVLFIATANSLSTIPRPLMDRLEIIEVSSYSMNEKFHIARRYLIGKQMKKAGLTEENLSISDNALREIISGYTREAGVRNLERKIGDICRKTAKEILLGKKNKVVVKQNNLEKYLGIPGYHYDKMFDQPQIGIVRGLAWTEVGGDTLSIELVAVAGKGEFRLTGRLGEVMKESANTAMSYLRSCIKQYHLPENFYKGMDFHIHIPEGAVPKDGPSAGITMATAMFSALTGRKVRNDVAMTGEITLQGRVLAIGGLKEKILAAKRAGISEVIVPEANRPTIGELDREITQNLTIHYVTNVEQVFELAVLPKTETAQKGEAAKPVKTKAAKKGSVKRES
ncbi:endopeptidase La [Clostridiales bacterium COT073_COT-073]|nr:endopeptidase La [Clostridiales bacterium COT073_COT-073]